MPLFRTQIYNFNFYKNKFLGKSKNNVIFVGYYI
jgi:hypothetical protein